MTVTLYNLDCRDALDLYISPESIDSIVTDPPYGIGFMGKAWDHGVPGVEFWKRAYDALKPGGHLLAFSGARTYHRMASAIEDAGFEIRDQIMWVYGSGFPKSLDVSKAIDKAAGAERGRYARPAFGDNFSDDGGSTYGTAIDNNPITDAAKQWDGWGTALKPAHEPICVARKPFNATVAENVQQHGTGAINIDGCRVGDEVRFNPPAGNVAGGNSLNMSAVGMPQDAIGQTAVGRWPANLIHDGSDEVVALFPDSKGQQGDVKGSEPSKTGGDGTNCYGEYGRVASEKRGDTGSAARFFYCAKASKKDREVGNNHPTVKPTELMRYLTRLVTPPGGTVLDMFMGSGSTGKAALLEGFKFIGVEMDDESFATAQRRVAA